MSFVHYISAAVNFVIHSLCCHASESERALTSSRDELQKSIVSQQQSAQTNANAEKLKVKFNVREARETFPFVRFVYKILF